MPGQELVVAPDPADVAMIARVGVQRASVLHAEEFLTRSRRVERVDESSLHPLEVGFEDGGQPVEYPPHLIDVSRRQRR